MRIIPTRVYFIYLTLLSCTCALRVGQVLADSCTDGVDKLFAGFGLCTSQSRCERFSRVASAT